ncbi:hypothetical protein GE061_008849 [Apolygus lucorum]|uniref:CCHC-type domain-containing protein n=1 Tax=Apolygus lucorum TaxID=248454 RepID=A0A8S9WR18_APOLU|nr:hypothetical protein GE061_008849 [Apolygus lucorum]
MDPNNGQFEQEEAIQLRSGRNVPRIPQPGQSEVAEVLFQPGETTVGPLFPTPSIANNEPLILPAIDAETPLQPNPPTDPFLPIDEPLKGPEQPSEHAVGELTRQVVMVLKELGWTPPVIPGSYASHDRSQQTSLVKTGFKPDLYDGSKSWADYKMHFDAVTQANNWDDRAAGLALAASLRGSAQCVLEEFSGRDYGELVEYLEMEFGDGNRAQVYEMQLRGRVQGAQEDFPDFARAVKVLARKAYPRAGAEAIGIAALGQFQDGLRNERVREMVIFGAPLTLRAAVDLAIRADVSLTRARVVPQQPRQFRQLEQQQPRQMIQMRRPIANNNDVEQERGMPAIRESLVCYRCDGQGHGVRDCPTRITICLRCDAPGHLARDCPTRVRPGNGHKSQ